jgi:hypothetical protein
MLLQLVCCYNEYIPLQEISDKMATALENRFIYDAFVMESQIS